MHDYPALRPLASATQAGIVVAGYGISAPEHGWRPDPAFFKGDTRANSSTRPEWKRGSEFKRLK